ncbi:TniB family NTP-binding protein [Pseudomonas hormoni]|jgi:hypothetical protein
MTSGLINPVLIDHAFFSQTVKRIERVVMRGLNGERLILPVFGPTRVGKSEAVDTVLSGHPKTVIEGKTRIPVLRLVTPNKPTCRSLPESLLNALGSRRYGRAGSEELTSRAGELLKMVGTRVLVLDEIQHFVEPGSRTGGREAADWLKVLSDEMNLTLILTGLPKAREVLLSNEQLRDRAENSHEFRPYNWNDSDEQWEFRSALLGVLDELAHHGWEVPDGQDIDFARRAYGSSLGRVGMVIKLFGAAVKEAEDKQITMRTLAKAHAQSIGTGFLQFNPFDDTREMPDHLLIQGFVMMLEEAKMCIQPALQEYVR